MTYKYRVYVATINGGKTYGSYMEYNDAKEKFDELVSKGHDAVYLQELNPTFGWVDRDLETHVTDEFQARRNAYWKYRAEEDESVNWRAGDAPWNAPGMSIRDFI